MKKKYLLLLLGVSMLVASGCGKKETVTAEELLGNPYGSAVESGDFDVTMKLTNADGEQTSSGNLQFDKDGVHFKSSDKEYYLIRSNSYVKGYDYVADTGRWTVKDEDSLDTSTMANLGILTNAVLSDWVITGDSTFDKAGHFGTCDKCLPGESPLGVTLTFDKDTKRLLKAEYVLKEEQPGGVKAYSLTVVCKSVNNIKVQLPDDIKNNAIDENGGSSSLGPVTGNQYVPDELIGSVELQPDDEIIKFLDEAGAKKTEYNGKIYVAYEDYDDALLKQMESEGMTELVEQVLAERESMAAAESEGTSETKAEETKVDETGDESEPETTAGSSTEPTVPADPVRITSSEFMGKSADGRLDALKDMYPGYADKYKNEDMVPGLDAAIGYSDASAILAQCGYWSSLSDDAKYAIAIHVDLGTVTLDQCVAAGADGNYINTALAELKG